MASWVAHGFGAAEKWFLHAAAGVENLVHRVQASGVSVSVTLPSADPIEVRNGDELTWTGGHFGVELTFRESGGGLCRIWPGNPPQEC